jgi:hypothetical protein
LLKDLLQLGFHFGELLCDPLAHLLLSEKLARVTSLALVTTGHQTGGILARSLQFVTLLNKLTMAIDFLENRQSL